MLLLLAACAWLPSAECRNAQTAQAAAWTLAADLAAAEAEAGVTEARARHAAGADADAAETEVPPAPDIEITQRQVSDESFTRALVTGSTLADAATAAQRAELALRTRKVLVVVEAETRRTAALTARIDAWRNAEQAWRDAGGRYMLSRQLRLTKGGEGLSPERAPVQSAPRIIEPVLPPGADPMGEELQGAQKAHIARLAAASGAVERHDRLQRVLDRGNDLQIDVEAGAAADPELRSAANEAKLVLGRAKAAQTALAAAQEAGETLDRDPTLTLSPALSGALSAARAHTQATEQLCR